jgi:ubiquinone/menaquinone biosynthesis C-methylase UbiE
MSAVANVDQFEAWNGEHGTRWVASADRRDHVLAPVADVLLEAARPAIGEAVLDVGCGCGATTLAAAELVSPDGFVTGVDLSAPMLAVARQRAERAECSNVRFVQADAQTHRAESRVDLVISRFGTMFFGDPVAAFTNLAALLTAGGRFCIATWQPLAANDWLTVPGAALLGYADLPPAEPGAPGMFAQSDPDTVRRVLTAAGLTDVSLDPVTVTNTIGATVTDAVDYLAESGPGRAILESIADADRDDALAAVHDALRPHLGDEGVRLDAAVWVVHATRA